MNRRGGKNRRDRGSRIKDDYSIDDRDHSFNGTMKDRNESRDLIRSYERPERMGCTTFEKPNRQDRGGGSVWMDRNRDRNSNIGGPQTRRITQEGEIESSWRRGGSGNITNDHFNYEGSDNGSYGGAAVNYVENRAPARSGGANVSRARGNEGTYMDRNDCCSNSQEFDGSGNHMNSSGQQSQTDRQAARQKIDNFTDNVDSNKKHGGNRGAENASNNDNRNSPEVKEGFNAKEIMDWMCERHNAVIKAYKNQNESKRSGSQPSGYEIKMYTPTDRCWSQRPILPSKDDFFQQLERAINQYKMYSSGGTSSGLATPGNDLNNRPIQNRTPMNQSGVGGPVGQRMQHYMQGQINLSQGMMGNMHQQQPQFSPGGLVSTPQQRHASHPMAFAAAPMTPSHGQQQLPQMMPNFLQQQQNPQFSLPQEIVQLHSQSPHAGLIPGAATPNMPPPHIFQQYLVHQHLMHTQFQQCQSLQTPSGMPPQSNFMNTPHPPMNPLSLSQQQPVFPMVGQHNIQQPHLPLNSYIQSVCPAPNMEQMQTPLASAEILNLACTNTPTAGNIFTPTTNSGGSNFSQPSSEKPKQQQTTPRNRERSGGGKDFECSSTDSIGSIREEVGPGNGTPSRQRCDKGVTCLSSYRSQDSIDSNNRTSGGGGPIQYRGGNGADRRPQETNNKDRANIDNSNGYRRESWSRQNSKECFQRRNYTAPTHEPKNSNSVNVDNQTNNDVVAAVPGSNDNIIASNNSKRVDNFNNPNSNNRQSVGAPPPPSVAENQEGNNGQTYQQPNNNNITGNSNNNQHLGRSSLSYSGTNKPQRKERNYANDRDNKNDTFNIKGTTTAPISNEKETPIGDQRTENRNNSKNYKHSTNLNNETETCNENSDDSAKTNNEKNAKGSPLSASALAPVPSPPVGGGGTNSLPQPDSKIRTERETRNNNNLSNN